MTKLEKNYCQQDGWHQRWRKTSITEGVDESKTLATTPDKMPPVWSVQTTNSNIVQETTTKSPQCTDHEAGGTTNSRVKSSNPLYAESEIIIQSFVVVHVNTAQNPILNGPIQQLNKWHWLVLD